MPCSPQIQPALHQLRFVFERSVPLLRFVPNVTPGDIARIWSAIADHHPEPPVVIDVTFAPNREDAPGMTSAPMGWLPAHLAWGRGPEK